MSAEILLTLSKILQHFLHTKARSSQLGAVNPLAPGAEDSGKDNRISKYDKFRDRADQDTTSRLRYASAWKILHTVNIQAKVFIYLQVLYPAGLVSELR
jgi:hypothetical protein